MPAEWAPHRAVWSAWPRLREEWGEAFEEARREMADFFAAIAHDGRGETVRLLVPDAATEAALRSQLDGAPAEIRIASYGDSWLRDTAPIFVRTPSGSVPVVFRFNGWGEKYDMAGDREVGAWLADQCAMVGESRAGVAAPLVLEGGSVDVDGQGTLLTTRQCLENPNRNPGMDRAQLESALGSWLGAERVIWLDEGLLNDHTDGHIDTIARFVAPGRVVCMHPASDDDPNAEALRAIERDLKAARDVSGRKLEVMTLPSPGKLLDDEGDIMPASYVNFYISNTRVLVPTYGVDNDARAVEVLQEAFPGREVLGCSARAVIRGGGAFHCITQQQPEGA